MEDRLWWRMQSMFATPRSDHRHVRRWEALWRPLHCTVIVWSTTRVPDAGAGARVSRRGMGFSWVSFDTERFFSQLGVGTEADSLGTEKF